MAIGFSITLDFPSLGVFDAPPGTSLSCVTAVLALVSVLSPLLPVLFVLPNSSLPHYLGLEQTKEFVLHSACRKIT